MIHMLEYALSSDIFILQIYSFFIVSIWEHVQHCLE